MKLRFLIIILSVTGSITLSAAAISAESKEAEHKDAEAKAAYQQALAEADESRAMAEAAIEKAREQIERAGERRRQEQDDRIVLREKDHAEIAAMRKELNRAHRELRESSREVSRVNRELARARMAAESANFVLSTGDRPVIGVILGDASDVGIEVLGVSPDGPAERGGIEAGDVIIAMGGRVLAAVDESGNPRKGLNTALKDIKEDEPVIITVERENHTIDLTVVPEVREPLSWQSVIRFPSEPDLAGDTVFIERIVVPEIDTEALTEQIEHMRIEIEERRALMEAELPHVSHFEFEFDDMSEMGDFALHDTNAWFGMPLASGLRLAAVGPGLGEYFKTERGVLVIKAKQDNDLLLQAGDVILSVQGTEVNSPAEFMRTLREFEPGDELLIDIKRKRKSKTLKPVIEDSHARFLSPQDHEIHKITITTDSG